MAELMSPERTWDKDLPDSSHQDHNEHKKAGGVVAGEGQGLCEENESEIQDAPKDLKNSQTRDAALLVRQLSGRGNQQPQPPGQIICWERFLPFRTLKILLVENDDSTRHVISALLCNCSYQVTAVANGLQAWRILQDLTNHIDLVLTEVIMPGLNGIGLLNKIMNHITCKSIPVIMMSSHDSMGTVFKCLSKGAVDFLVKPIRKNELKNLWQHVWRRCHSSSGSGSESGTQTQKSVKSKSLDDSDNSHGSNNDKTISIHLNARDSSDNGSGTQSSWTERAAEVSSPQNMSSSDQLADPLDSTCALVIHAANDILCKDHMPTSANREKQDKQELSDDCTGNDSEIGECKNLERQCETPLTEQDFTKQTGKKVDRLPEKGSKNECCLGSLSTNILNKPIAQAANLIGAIASSLDSQVVSRVVQAPSGLSKASLDQDKVNCALSDSAAIELSLKRLRSIGETRTSTQDERNVLRRLDLSAFSRYNKSDASNQPQIGYGRSFSPLDSSSEAIKTGSTYNIMLNTAPLEQGSNGSSNNNDIGSTAKNTFRKPPGMKEKTASTSIVKCIHSSAFYSVQFRTLEKQDHLQGSVENLTAPSATGKGKEIQHQVPSQHHRLHHSNPHHYHYVHSIQQPTPDQNDLTLKCKAEESPQCGSSNVFNWPFEGNAANYSVNGSNSGSIHGSNGNNDNNNATRTGGSKTESANDIAEQSGSGSGNGSRSSSGSGTDQNPLTHREAALKKFREKRKERNYGKKVRYQSRKRLAEQRPRVHGQFARKSVHKQTSGDADR